MAPNVGVKAVLHFKLKIYQTEQQMAYSHGKLILNKIIVKRGTTELRFSMPLKY